MAFTHFVLRVLSKPNNYIKTETNPNPNDDAESFLCIRRVSHVEADAFSKPYNNWHLSKEDEKTIDELEKNFLNKQKKIRFYGFLVIIYGSFLFVTRRFS